MIRFNYINNVDSIQIGGKPLAEVKYKIIGNITSLNQFIRRLYQQISIVRLIKLYVKFYSIAISNVFQNIRSQLTIAQTRVKHYVLRINRWSS